MEQVWNWTQILHIISKVSWFLNVLTSLPFRLWILYLDDVIRVVVIPNICIKELLIINGIDVGLVVILLYSFRAIVALVFLKKISNQLFWWVIIRWFLNIGKLILTIVKDYLLTFIFVNVTHFPRLWQNFICLRNFFVLITYSY